MEIYFLDEKFGVTDGPIDEFSSVVIEERYFETGKMTLRFPRSLFRRASGAVYIMVRGDDGTKTCGRVDYILALEGEECEMGAHLLEVLLDDVVMRGGVSYSGSISEVIRAVLTNNLGSTNIVISDVGLQLPDEVAFDSSWENLGSFLRRMLRVYGASYKIELDEDAPTITLYSGRDLTSESGDTSSRAVFSGSLGNISALEYEKNTADWKNFVYVVGADGSFVTVDNSGGKTRREIVRKANDIKRDSFETEEEYVIALTKRGEEALSEYPEAVSVYGECDEGALPVYGSDYGLGDICDASDAELGLSFALRVTSVSTVYECGKRSVFPTLGYEARYFDRLRYAE